VVNEVLANEPGSYTSLEWIELYNAGLSASLEGYCLRIGGDVIELPSEVVLQPDEYYLVCRRLYATATSPGFESHWGDSSGVWGDTEYEQSVQTPFETSFSLGNDSGAVELLYNSTSVSLLEWTSSGLDGHSWEGLTPFIGEVGQCIDPLGSTPGMVNSLTPVPYDLALMDVKVASDNGLTVLTFEIVNAGLNPVGTATITLTAVPDTVDIFELDATNPGDTVRTEREYMFDGMYLSLLAFLSSDDRARNDSCRFVAPGIDYPPLILSEMMPNPDEDLGTEWLEVKNISSTNVYLCQWRFGDALRLCSITGDPDVLGPGEYLVLAQSETDLLAHYSDFDGICIEPSSWPSLNNDGDLARLVDTFGIRADLFEYVETYENNYTWSRDENSVRWGRSSHPGGTPGRPNETVFPQTTSALKVSLDPAYVSPDGDGFQDVTNITIEAPFAGDYTVRIYDRQGRVVRHLYEEQPLLPGSIEWDGLSDSGRRLPIGLYILYVEAAGVESVKVPIVVAR